MPKPFSRPCLQHLILIPSGGLCNRLRTIASARRLCSQSNARCSVLWSWGNFRRYFCGVPDVRFYRKLRAEVDASICHYPHRLNPRRVVDVTVPVIAVQSAYVFWGSHESPLELRDLKRWLPALHPRLMRRVVDFSRKHLQNAVGFHIRRTDNTTATQYSPDSLFLREARQIIASGKKIFLATDNINTERLLQRLFGKAVIVHPKRRKLRRRWPRAFDSVALEDDLIDLFLLARTEYVLGSYWSSFSAMAIELNGSSRSRILKKSR